MAASNSAFQAVNGHRERCHGQGHQRRYPPEMRERAVRMVREAIAESGERLIERLANVPTPAGPTPTQLAESPNFIPLGGLLDLDPTPAAASRP